MAQFSTACVAIAFTLLAFARELRAEPTVKAPAEYRFYFDPKFRGEAGTLSITNAARLALRGEDEVLSGLPLKDRSGFWSIATRLLAMIAIDLPIASYQLVLAHELLGHGARYREFGGQFRAEIGAPLPFDLSPDHKVFPANQTRPLYWDELTIVHLGGQDVQSTAQRNLAFEGFSRGQLARGDAFLYAGNALTKMAQLIGARDLDNAAHSMAAPRKWNADGVRDWMKASIAFELIDPLLWFSLYASAYRYLVRGETDVAFPSLRVGDTRLFATSRVNVVPWGISPNVELFAALPKAVLSVALRPGLGPNAASILAEVGIGKINVLGPLQLNVGLAGWAQPGLWALHYVGRDTKHGVLIDFGPPIPAKPPPQTVLGIGGYVEAAARLRYVTLGTRITAKTAGIWSEKPLAPDVQVALMSGVILY
ncbi:MAG: hypothetical protein IPK82_12545 [Polyangiaceae bacterium]|nr:hypothetical protein [Polyangiaceae bacterium]